MTKGKCMTAEIVTDTFNYTEVATGGANKRGKVKRLEDVEPHGADFYTSVYDHAADFEDYVKERGTCKGYKGAVRPRGVHFDIDRPELADALGDAQRLGSRLVKDYSVPPDMVRYYFSGSKGFHGEVPLECFGGIEASVNAPERVKNLALRILDGMETDTAVYDRNRLWRSPNTLNAKGDPMLYKVPLTHHELMTLSIDEIKELARKPRTVNFSTPAPVPALVSLNDSTKVVLRDEAPKITDGQTENLAAVIQEFMPPVGDRHLYVRALIGYLLPRLKKPLTLSVVLDAWEGSDAETLERVEALVNDTADKWMNDEPFEGGPILEKRAPGILDAIGGVLKPRPDKPRKGLLSGAVPLGEMMKHGIEPPDELIDGVLLEGRTHQIFCGPGKGKTFVALWMAVKLVNRGRRVLYLDKENGPRIIRNRLVALGADPAKVDANLVYVPFPSLDLDPDAVQDYIGSLEGFSLVIFDSWINYLAAAGLDENSNGDLARWSTTFCSEARKRNISVLLLDHVGKDSSNGSRGASRKLDEMDVAWELRTLIPFGREQPGMIQLRRKKDREAWLSPTVEFEIGGNPFVMRRVDGFEIPEPDSVKSTLKAIKGFGADGAKYGEWLKATDAGRTQFTEARKTLLGDGRVVKSGSTYYAAELSPGAQPDQPKDDLVREPEPDQTGLAAENSESGAEPGKSRSGGGTGLEEESSPQISPVRVPNLSGDRAGLVDRGSVEPDQNPDVQGCGACNTTARFEFHGGTKHCTNCGQEYPYEEYERGQREGAA